MTLNQILARIKNITEAHEQINTYVFGDIDEFLDIDDNVYPACFCATPTASISGKQLVYNFRLFFLDRMIQDNSNVEEVYSDTMETAKDILAQLCYPKSPWIVEPSATFELFNGNREDYLAGVAMDVQIKIDYLTDRCVIPTTYEYQ